MKYIKLLWFDVFHGLLRKPLLFAIPVIVALIACFDLVGRVAELNSFGYFSTKTQAGFADFVMYIYGGMDTYIPGLGEPFMFPVRWLVVFLSVVFITLDYPYKDMQGYGQQILIRTKGRMAWWLSKCGWNTLCILVYHGLVFLSVALFCAITKSDFTGGLNKNLIYVVFQVERIHMASDTTIWTYDMLLLPIFVSFGMNMLQMTLSLFIKPAFSFLITAFLMISSAYFTTPYLVGNYAMPIRYDVVITNGVSAKTGVIISAAIALLAIIAGSIRFRRYDILNRD